MIYADHNATTPPLPAVVEAVAAAMRESWGNPGSRQHPAGRRALDALDAARERIALTVAARPDEVVLTSGATEACNLALLGLGERLLATRPRFVTCATEHPAVLAPLRRLAEAGAEVVVLPPERDGRLDPDRLADALDGRTALLALMLVNHETGIIHDVAAAAELAHHHGALVVCDATQAVGRMPVDVAALGVDALAWSAHKLYGPQGAGALWLRRGLGVTPLAYGGGQERGLRPGTPNVPAAVGFGVASEAARLELTERAAHLSGLTVRLEALLRERLPGVVVHGADATRAPGTTMLTMPGLPAGWLATLATVAASGGAACSGGQGSSVLRAMGVPEGEATNALRLSLGLGTIDADLPAIADELARGAAALRRRQPSA
jgi:cysteine desulfurase